MKLKKSFQLALNILFHSKLRSWLTIIGIIIGIGAVVSIVSISTGAQQNLEQRLGSLGADIITISPGASRARGIGFGGDSPGGMEGGSSSVEIKNLTSKDIFAIKSVSNIKEIMGQVSDKGTIGYSSKTASVSITGVDPLVWEKITTEKIDSGRLLMSGDSYSVVLGGQIVSSMFENGIPLNSKITIEGKIFKVVGILTEGRNVYIPIGVARTVLENVGDKEFNSISVKVEDVELSDQTVTDITQKLMFSRGILQEKQKDFTVTSMKTTQETIQSTMNTMSLFLGAIAAISLLVGAIGIANTMFTSVLEKTREIGIMKAIGAKNIDILMIFLLNSGLIGLVGGIGGIILGILGSGLVSYLGSSGGGMTGNIFSNTAVTPGLLIFALGFSIFIGMIAGVIPAYRASKLNPVDALRYE